MFAIVACGADSHVNITDLDIEYFSKIDISDYAYPIAQKRLDEQISLLEEMNEKNNKDCSIFSEMDCHRFSKRDTTLLIVGRIFSICGYEAISIKYTFEFSVDWDQETVEEALKYVDYSYRVENYVNR